MSDNPDIDKFGLDLEIELNGRERYGQNSESIKVSSETYSALLARWYKFFNFSYKEYSTLDITILGEETREIKIPEGAPTKTFYCGLELIIDDSIPDYSFIVE
jgi:hypothetical protein